MASIVPLNKYGEKKSLVLGVSVKGLGSGHYLWLGGLVFYRGTKI